jgi:hypothetical protein
VKARPHTLTLNLSDRENAALVSMAEEMDLSKSGVLRQAIRVLQIVHENAKQGTYLQPVGPSRLPPDYTAPPKEVA